MTHRVATTATTPTTTTAIAMATSLRRGTDFIAQAPGSQVRSPGVGLRRVVGSRWGQARTRQTAGGWKPPLALRQRAVPVEVRQPAVPAAARDTGIDRGTGAANWDPGCR